jgi:hypothetical protein
MTLLVLPSANTAMKHLFLEQVGKSFENYCIAMQVDQADWHRSNELLVPANIRLIEQPACSPEVDLVEHLWEELREKYLHNRLFLSPDLLVEVLCQALNELTEGKEGRSMMSFPHLDVSIETADVSLFFSRPIGYCMEALCSGLRIFKSNDTKKRPISPILLQKACYR